MIILTKEYIDDHCANSGISRYKLKEFTIPDSVTEIRDEAFWHCSSLESITIPDSITEIGHFPLVYG